MTDIHCHILPEIDDGAATIEESLEMAGLAVSSGVTDIVATPHFRGEPDQLEYLQTVDRRFSQLKEALEQAQIPLRIHPGAEILCVPETPALAQEHRLPVLGGSQYVLTEFYFDESFVYMDTMLSDIAVCGYRPVVAHPERYDVLQRDPGLAERWARQGYVLQMNKGSILGMFGPRVGRTADAMLELGLVHLIASDAHGSDFRTPHMGALLQWAEEFCDPDFVRILLEENPARLLRGESMVGE